MKHRDSRARGAARRTLPALLLLAGGLLGGCVYNPYTGTYEPGAVGVAAPAYAYYPGYYPGYGYPAPEVVIGGGFGYHHWPRYDGWHR
jgi:hypothetical protein